MSRVISLRLRDEQVARLSQIARRFGRKPTEQLAQLVEEGLRMVEYTSIEFRDSIVGRQAYVSGSTLAVWEVVMVARSYDFDAARTADHLQWPLARVQAALRYAADFRTEIEIALHDNDAQDFASLSRLLRGLRRFIVSSLQQRPGLPC